MKEQIVISGMGCISAAGLDLAAHNQSLNNEVVNCQMVPDWLFKTNHNYPVFICPQKVLTENGKEFLHLIEKKDENDLGRTAQLMVSATAEAINSAGLSVNYLRKKRLGVAIGTTVGCAFNNENYYRTYRNGEKSTVKPVIDYLNSNLAHRLHTLLGTDGPSIVITNACASGTDAIGVAGAWIASGYCDIAIAGGADELSRIAYNGFISLQLTASSPCRPFDKTRQGLNLGEGSGIVILEKEKDAFDRDSVIGRLRGYGSSSDAWHPTAPHPEGEGVVRAVKLAAVEAGDINLRFDLINAHGTATKANDVAETNALAIILAEQDGVPIISTKGITGHTLGAAGAIEAILTLLSLKQKKIGGTIGCQNVDPDLKVIPLSQTKKMKLTGKVGLSQSLAFGGGNSALIVEAI